MECIWITVAARSLYEFHVELWKTRIINFLRVKEERCYTIFWLCFGECFCKDVKYLVPLLRAGLSVAFLPTCFPKWQQDKKTILKWQQYKKTILRWTRSGLSIKSNETHLNPVFLVGENSKRCRIHHRPPTCKRVDTLLHLYSRSAC